MRACCHSGREPLHSGREPTLTACYLQALGRFVQAGFAPLPASSSILHLHPASGLRPRFRRSFPVFAPVPVLPDIDYDGFTASAVDLDYAYVPPVCRGSLAGRRAAAPGLRTTCIRRAASSTGLSRYLIRGLFPFHGLFAHSLLFGSVHCLSAPYIYVLCLPAPPTRFPNAFPSYVFLFSLLICTPIYVACAIYLEGYYFLSSSRTMGFPLTSLPAAKNWRN
jgi:hypothetical protein